MTNILAAVTVARLFNVPSRIIKKTLFEFNGLQGRLELILELKGVKYFNDTTATIPEATIEAINSLSAHMASNSNRLILIAGGADKNLYFGKLADLIVEKIKYVFLLSGTATPKLEEEIKKRFLSTNAKLGRLHLRKFNSIEKAVAAAAKIAKDGDMVLLSPSCASFGMFRHEFERGEKFIEAVNKLQ
ncbi:MAG: hypothetical protein A2174_00735 [Candidatus Portnoybacteria bacterium RBG_13_41_18]|uniref:Mur ligase C-terminal domain-containing protein n=1 Tax=Candidatus Portnoybacteria bacterium RBG_13_41_18 TaxID=1801991 RepID=A0A1G2F926_9BACT|nr:MAG: hypothetical protein A2174_00735 [Candidatus Portnoybacteria bacterium RBG_13_41_18]